MNEDYVFAKQLIESAFEHKQIYETDLDDLMEMFLDSDGENLDDLLKIDNLFIYRNCQFKIDRITERLAKADAVIEAETNPVKKARYEKEYVKLCNDIVELAKMQEDPTYRIPKEPVVEPATIESEPIVPPAPAAKNWLDD